MGERSCIEGRIGCLYDYGELDDEPCYSCHKGSHWKPRPSEVEKPGVPETQYRPGEDY